MSLSVILRRAFIRSAWRPAADFSSDSLMDYALDEPLDSNSAPDDEIRRIMTKVGKAMAIEKIKAGQKNRPSVHRCVSIDPNFVPDLMKQKVGNKLEVQGSLHYLVQIVENDVKVITPQIVIAWSC